MELKASKIITALEFLQDLAINPLQSVSSKHKSVLTEIRKSYFPKNAKSTTGKKRKQPPSKAIAPKAKRQRLSRSSATKARKSDKEENDDYDEDDHENEDDEDGDDEDEDDSDDIEEVTDIEDNDHMHGVSLIEEHASSRNIHGDSPSHFTYFGEDQGVFIADKDDLAPLWSHGNPQHNALDNYLQSVSKLFYHPIEAMDQHLFIQKQAQNKNPNDSKKTQTSRRHKTNKKKNEDESEEKILRYSTINLLLSPLRKRSPFDEWCPREIALFESAMCCKGKQFHEISKIIQTKNTKECVEFYYFWKQSSHYTIWKALGRKTKKQLSRTQKKLHKRIGDRFAEFHSSIYRNKRNQNQSQPPVMQQDLHTQYIQSANSNNNNNNNNNNSAVLVHQQQPQPAAMGIIGYYPQYYGNGYGQNGYCAQNGYQWFHNSNVYNHQYQAYNTSQSQPAQPQTPNNNNTNNKNPNDMGCNSNNGNSMSTISPDGNEDNADFIDLTETASSNGDNGGSSKDIASDHELKHKNKNNITSLKKHPQKKIDNAQDINQSVTT